MRTIDGWKVLIPVLVLVGGPGSSMAAQEPGSTFEQSMPPGANFDHADFRLWLPAGNGAVRGVVVLMPGSNGDGRPETADTVWQSFATQHRLALLGVRLTDKRHDQGFIEEYVDVGRGSGQALLDALTALAASSRHPELASAPLLLWGMSAGGEFNYEFTNWKPERVVAFVVNKGGIYYTALTSRAARSIPGVLFTGGNDLVSRVSTISGLFALNRRSAALWALANEPGAAHIVGRSRDFALIFFGDVLALRLPDSTASRAGVAMLPVAPGAGFVGDLKLHTYQPAQGLPAGGESTVWLPTERVARAWGALVTGQPFD